MNTVLILFIAGTIANVILSTIKSIVTVKGGKFAAGAVNAITYGLYTYVIILTTSGEISTSLKMIITAAVNFVCVSFVKWIEEKRTPVRMWKLEMAIPKDRCHYSADVYKSVMEDKDIPSNYQEIGRWMVFNCYCETKEQTSYVKWLCKNENGKISAYESKDLW